MLLFMEVSSPACKRLKSGWQLRRSWRAAEKLGLTREHVRAVAVGIRRSDAVSAVLKSERDKILARE